MMPRGDGDRPGKSPSAPIRVPGDQNDPAILNEMATRHGPFDIIIDDGSHVGEHIITSFRALFPDLTANGLYAIEDL